MRVFASVLACGAVLLGAGCTTTQVGPQRPITIEDDVALMRVLAQPDDLSGFYMADPDKQAMMRNQIVTARMYIADMEYHYYEARLTRDLQEEGLAATLASLGLTTSATLFGAAQTKTILSGIATGVTGADKAYSEKVLLSNTIQALQTQMRADRKEQAGAIYAKMSKSPGVLTSIAEYTLPMALSDADAYYQAGTMSSALIGLSKTLSAKEAHADQAKVAAGPNPNAVASVKGLASPATGVPQRPTIIRDVNTPLRPFTPPPPPAGRTSLGPYEAQMSNKDMKRALAIVGCSGDDFGRAGSTNRKALSKFFADNGLPASETLTNDGFTSLLELKTKGKQGNCAT